MSELTERLRRIALHNRNARHEYDLLDTSDELEEAADEFDRLLKEIEVATHKLTCVSIERECKCVPEIVRVCDHQAIGVLQEAAEKARTT